jgi:BirA family transcriptional regulator, biotin operon repressor / biotin---[acetyl-CoA-carboxylase] ligase
MTYILGLAAAQAGYRLVAFDEVGSTNDVALAMARDGDTGPVWVTAERQTGGRGRRGRAWQSLSGNMAASLLIGAEAPVHQVATLGFVAGLALHDAIAEVGRLGPEDDRLRLKWPNDLVADGGKVAGILLDSEAVGGRPAMVVVGIGVNVGAAPRGLPYPATSLAAMDLAVSAEVLLATLTDCWVRRYDQWRGGAGMAAIRSDWLERAVGLGGPVVVEMGTRRIAGTFETLDGDGRLIVRADDGSLTPIAAGEVQLGAASSLTAAG